MSYLPDSTEYTILFPLFRFILINSHEVSSGKSSVIRSRRKKDPGQSVGAEDGSRLLLGRSEGFSGNVGRNEGKDEGFNEGFSDNEGSDEGKDEVSNEGFADNEGLDEGLDVGRDVGKDVGHAAPKNMGTSFRPNLSPAFLIVPP